MSVRKLSLSAGAREAARLSLTLFAITAAAALVLSLVHAATAERIADGAAERRQVAMEAVAPGADIFSQLPYDPEKVHNMHAAFTGGTFLGYCVEVAPNGFGGPISLLVGVSDGGSVLGVSVLEQNETPGLGSNVRQAEYLDRFKGLSGTIQVGSGGNSVEAVSGATISSRAVTEGVNQALAAVADFQREGGMRVEEDAVESMD